MLLLGILYTLRTYVCTHTLYMHVNDLQEYGTTQSRTYIAGLMVCMCVYVLDCMVCVCVYVCVCVCVCVCLCTN